jgi:RodZ C-terminal domain
LSGLEFLNTCRIVVIVLAFFLIVDGLLFYRYQKRIIALEKPLDPTAEETAFPAPQRPHRADVSVGDEPTQLTVRADGETVIDEVAESGFFREVEAEREFSVRAENAGVVFVEVDGESIDPLGELGEEVETTWREPTD